MRHRAACVRSAIGLAAWVLAATGAWAQDIPPNAFREWLLYNNNGWKRLNAGDYLGAEKRFNLAIQAIRPYDTADGRLLARSYNDLARALYHQGRFAEAEPLARWSLTVRQAHPRSTDEIIFQSAYGLAQIYRAEKKYREAEPLYAKALDLQYKALGPHDPQVGWTLDAMAEVYREQGRLAEAERFYKRAIAIGQTSQPEENLALAETSEHYAVLLRRVHRDAEAEDLEERAKMIRDAAATRAARSARARPSRGQAAALAPSNAFRSSP